MSRLTDYKGYYCFLACEETRGEEIKAKCNIYNQCLERKVYDKLCHYEDLEEQGRLIELPCKVGGEIWVLEYDSTFRASGEIFKDEFEISDLPFMGSWIFATKEEAEAKLAELKGGGGDV